MSDIAKKTLPPGSWPAGSKGGKGTATATEAASEAAPRSATGESPQSIRHQQHNEDSELHDETTSHYTHQKDNALGDIQEENNTTSGLDVDADDEHQIELEDQEAASHLEGVESAGDDLTGEQPAASEGDEGYGSRSSQLTERAKQAFDAAAQNQPTSEARDEFLKSAHEDVSGVAPAEGEAEGEGLEVPEGAEEIPGSQVQEALGELEEGVHAGTEGLEEGEGEDATEHAGEQATENVPTHVPTVQFEDQLEGYEGEEGEEEEGTQKTPTQTEGLAEGAQFRSQTARSQLPTEQRSQFPEGEQLPTELRSQFPEEGEVPQTAPTQIGTQAGSQVPFDLAQLPESIKEQLMQGIVPSELRSKFGTETAKDLAEHAPAAIEAAEKGEEPEEELAEGTQAELAEAVTEATETEPQLDFTVLKNGRVNKGGNVVDEDGRVIGRVTEGVLKYLVGRRVDEEGNIWGDNGKVLGRAEPIPDDERDELTKEAKPFESFPGAVVDADGMVVFNGEYVGKVTAGDLHLLRGKEVDADGDILDKGGNVIGKAERWEPEPEAEPEPEPEVDLSILAGKRVNKAGNVVDSSGAIFGRVVEGDIKRLVGRMCDKFGNILSESGDVLGRAELIPEGEREGIKEGPFAELEGCTVAKDGTVVTPSGDVVGRLISGDPKILFGRAVDEDGDVVDRNGNVLGKAERWSPPEVEKKKNPMSGRRVNRQGDVVDEDGNVIGKLTTGSLSVCAGKEIDDEGDVIDGKGTVIGHVSLLEEIPENSKKNPMSGRRVNRQGDVVDEDGNLIGKLTSGNLSVCSGKEIDDDGDVIDGKGTVIGHVSLLEEIPEPEPEVVEEETPEEKAKREQAEQDKKLAVQMTVCIAQCLDKIRPICKMITQRIDREERKPEEERDEEELVKEVKPLIEEGGRILQEAKGIIKGLDPDGRIAANAKHKTAAREATPEEYQLADVLKDLTGEVTECIENAKRKIEDMPHAKKELNPLWGLLNEPLFQILAAVGLLLNGVLSLVGRLLSGLGLGGLLDGLLGTLGLNRVLEGLGLGQVTKSLTGGGDKKKSGGGGLLGGLLGGR